MLRLTSPDAEPWDLAIGAPNWWRAPSPTVIALISDGTGYLVDVAERRVLFEEAGVTRIREAEQSGLLLMCTARELIALDADGVAWRTVGLAVDDLKSLPRTASRSSAVV